ncbi:hypothetical protein Ancab_026127 [Ancistrocladus abbreviatus]
MRKYSQNEGECEKTHELPNLNAETNSYVPGHLGIFERAGSWQFLRSRSPTQANTTAGEQEVATKIESLERERNDDSNRSGQHSAERNQDATSYVGNLDPQVTEELLWELFVQAGPVVNVYVPKD